MELAVEEVLMILAMVDRLRAENVVFAAHVDGLVAILTSKGVFSEEEKSQLIHAFREQRNLARQAQPAENQPGNPGGAPFHRELSEELRALGVISDNPTVGDQLQENFEHLLERVLERFRMNRGEGDAGKPMRV